MLLLQFKCLLGKCCRSKNIASIFNGGGIYWLVYVSSLFVYVLSVVVIFVVKENIRSTCIVYIFNVNKINTKTY